MTSCLPILYNMCIAVVAPVCHLILSAALTNFSSAKMARRANMLSKIEANGKNAAHDGENSRPGTSDKSIFTITAYIIYHNTKQDVLPKHKRACAIRLLYKNIETTLVFTDTSNTASSSILYSVGIGDLKLSTKSCPYKFASTAPSMLNEPMGINKHSTPNAAANSR